MTTPILFADFENLIPVIVSIIGIVIYAINQMFEKEKQQANQRRARAQQAARAPQPQHGGGGAGGGDPVDQFLREVAQLRGAPEQPRRDVQVVRPQQQRQRSSQQQRPAQQRQPQRSRRDTAAGQQRRSQTVVQPPQRQDSLASRSMEFNSRTGPHDDWEYLCQPVRKSGQHPAGYHHARDHDSP